MIPAAQTRERDPDLHDVAGMTDEELLYWNTRIKGDAAFIHEQINLWVNNLTPPHLDNRWRDRADKARAWKTTLRAALKTEITRRRVAAERAPPVAKAAAFVYAAKTLLPKETFLAIWAEAERANPDLFPPRTA